MSHYGRCLLAGITRYLRTSPPWSIDLDLGEFDAPVPSWFKGWRGDGVICRALTAPFLGWLAKANVPTVNLSGAGNDCHGLPWIRAPSGKGFSPFCFLRVRREGMVRAKAGRARRRRGRTGQILRGLRGGVANPSLFPPVGTGKGLHLPLVGDVASPPRVADLQ
jgi:hypothetical protein